MGIRKVFKERRRWINYRKEHTEDLKAFLPTGSEGELAVFSDRILKRQGALGELQSLEGVTVTLEDTGTLSARTTLARAGTVGGGWQKSIDTRQTYMCIEGPEFSWVITLPPAMANAARVFATQTNLQVRRQFADTID